MGKHTDWSGVTDILGRAASELRHEVKDIAQSKSGNVRETLASAVDDIAQKIRTAGPDFGRSSQSRNQHGVGPLPILLGLGVLAGVAALLASDHKTGS